MLEVSFSKAILIQQGKLAEGIRVYEALLPASPNDDNRELSDLKQHITQEQVNELLRLYNSGKYEVALEKAVSFIKIFPESYMLWNIVGAANKALGRFQISYEAFKKVTVLNPSDASGFNNLGVSLKDLNRPNEALACYEKALSLHLDYAEAYNNMGVALNDLGKFDEALSCYEKALSIKPDYAEALYNMGIALQDKTKFDEALSCYEKALSIKPDYAEAYNNMGNILHNKRRLNAALSSYEKAILLKPDYAEAYNNIGITLHTNGKLDKALVFYEKALTINADYAEVYNNVGVSLRDQGEVLKAIGFYEKAISLKSDYYEAFNNLGIALNQQGKLDEAIRAYKKALSIKADYAEAYYNMGISFQYQGILDKALKSFEKALLLSPGQVDAQVQRLHQKALICDWSAITINPPMIESLGVVGDAVNPFSMLAIEDKPNRQRLRSENYAKNKFSHLRIMFDKRPHDKPKRLRVGYFSSDFYDHATMYLMAQVFELHDKSNFEIFAFSYGADKKDEMFQRLINSVSEFHNVRELSDAQIVELARSKQLDIAVDLKGYTKDHRLVTFAHGLAPVQISYLGYPGTLGAKFIDYIIADQIVIPEDKRQHYSEQIIYLPHTYQPTDDKRVISDKVINRGDVGLPEDGFVFCCFNNTYKISFREFDIWMRLLQKVNGSVLWLLKANNWAEQNLKREAESRGIEPHRLIFAERLPQSEHLARQKLADLFLDTFNYNAHTTTSDALWAEVPVLTKLGGGFSARVAGSLLHAIGLPELITETEEQYETLALELASNPDRLQNIKNKLAANRLKKPLFNSERYTLHLEAAYQTAYERYFNGLEPKHIFVDN